MTDPSRLLLKLAQRLFPQEADRTAFVTALTQPQSFAPSILWCRDRPPDLPFAVLPPVAWQPSQVDRLAGGQRPGQHELHQAGAFYCLDFSSVFAISVLQALPTLIDPPRVIDVCAAPGGKSISAWRLLQPEWLISNEVIAKRSGALISNLRRCQVQPSCVTRLDSQVLAQAWPQTADVVLVDAPCTGQSLLAKGDKAPGCFHPVTIKNNANRQKRILANSAQLVAPQGYLVYMTCAYSLEENEQVVDWLLARFPQFHCVTVPHLAEYQSRWSDRPMYRMFPQSGLGAGAFTTLMQNTEIGQRSPLPPDFLQRPGFTRIGSPGSDSL